MRRFHSVSNIVKLHKHAEMQKHFLLLKSAFHFFHYSILKSSTCYFFFIKNKFYPEMLFGMTGIFFAHKHIQQYKYIG